MRTRDSSLSGFVALAVSLWAMDGGAYPTYSATADPPAGNCVTCHGDFRGDPYERSIPPATPVDQGWGTDLMDAHQDVILNECGVCHGSSNNDPVSISLSEGTTKGAGNDPFEIGCLGCHGRDETGEGSTGSGLRQRHTDAGVFCGSCHSDDNPMTFTPVGEDVLPPYYDLDLSVVTLTDPCNEGGTGEDFAGSASGLDNDGDGLYDEADTINCPEPGALLLQCAALASVAVVAQRRGRRT
jgi:hypothetical protein